MSQALAAPHISPRTEHSLTRQAGEGSGAVRDAVLST